MSAATAEESGERVFASPLARRLAREAGLELRLVEGTGPHGRVIERDVIHAQKSGAASARAEPQKFETLESYVEIPLDSMRKTIARRLTEAAQTIPHFYLTCDCELDALLRLREDINAAAPGAETDAPEWKISVNDLIVKAMAAALQQVPDANVTFTPEALQRHASSDVGVAVSIPGGLITPIIRGAEKKSLKEISAEIKEKSKRAKDRRLKPSEYEGGVSAVSNLGMFGVRNFTAVINPPQSTILAVGAGESRVVVRNGAPAVATVMTVTLSCDHRAVDGVLGAKLLAAFKRLVEHPAAMLA
jgi:pyruvate dehydrogenase E2 component (dihydrolipoamide acetyltransferase)